MSEIKVISAEEYEQVIASGAVVIDFYAEWCGPCKMMSPIFEEAQDTYAGEVTFAKINVDNARDLAMANKIMSIPTLMFFKDGELVERVSGVLDKAALEGKLRALL